MTEGPDGLPATGPSARQLGVRPGPGKNTDIPVDGGTVKPGTGGMSVAPDTPMNLPEHRRPPEFGGGGRDPVWEFDLDDLPGDGAVKYFKDKPDHGNFEPGYEMSIEGFQQALADLANKWKKL